MSQTITYKNLQAEYHALMAQGAFLPEWTDERALEMLTYKLNRLGSTFLEEAEFINDVIQWQDFLPYIFSDEEVRETDETGFVSRTIDKDACEKQLRKFIGQIKNPTLSLALLYYFASDSFIDNVLNRGYIIYRGCGDYIKGLCAKLMGEINRSHHTQTIDDLANLGSDYGSSIPDSAKKQKLPLKTITYIDGAPHVMEIYEVGNSKTPQNMQNRKTAPPSMNTTFTKPTADFNQYRYAAIRDFLHNTYHFNEFASIKLVRWGDCILKSFYLGNYHNDFEEFLTSTCKALQIDMDCCLNSSEILWPHWVVYIAWMLSRINGNKIAEEKHKSLDKAFISKKSIQDYVFTDGYASDGDSTEHKFAEALEHASEVVVYAKLPKGFHIPTPVGNYSPDWAIAFQEGVVKHVYFIAETKGDNTSLQFKAIETAKITCARSAFKLLSENHVNYDVVKDFSTLMKIVKGE